jgi:membrane-bound serine protease (ClpP class)
MRARSYSGSAWRGVEALWCLAFCALWGPFVAAQEDAAIEAEQAAPIGQFMTIPGSVDDVVMGKVNRAALALQSRAREERRKAVLVLEITAGSSPFHQVQGMARFLANDLSGLKTVAWIPKTVTGNHVVLALACAEIVMAPDAELGDISLGKPLDPDEQSFVINLANKRHNRKINEALILGMIDRQKEIFWVQVELGKPPAASKESRVVSRAGHEELLASKVPILNVRTLKEAGAPGIFTGERARNHDILVERLAQSRDEVALHYRLPREAMREQQLAGEAHKAMIIHVDSMIEPILEQFVLRQIDRAVAGGYNLLIFQIESPGGFLDASLNLSQSIVDLRERKVRAVAYVPRQALSGAAIIALGADEIYLAPDAMFGDAGPIELREGGQFERAPEKQLSLLKEQLKLIAEKKGRPSALASAMADRNLKVYEVTHKETGQIWYMSDDEIHAANDLWVKGRPVPESGENNLLTVNGRRAHELHLAEPPVASFEELKGRLGIPANEPVPVSTRTWVDTLVFILNSTFVTVLLVVVGLMCIYFELHFPTGLFGICSCVCFGLFFWSRFLGGTAVWLEVMLFLLGAGCLAIEFFVIPGFGVFGVSGIVLCLCSLVLATQTFWIPHSAGELKILARSVGTMATAIAGVVVLAVTASRYLPSMPWLGGMILTPPGGAPEDSSPRLRPDLVETPPANPLLERDPGLVGKKGVSLTVLRPSGRAQIGDDFVDVVSEGPFIDKGRTIEVLAVEGMRVVVREVG